jgi:class 3 adenylate cyclase
LPQPFDVERTVALQVPPDDLWSLVADTDRFNHALGLPAVAYRFDPIPGGGSRMWAKTRMVGFPLEWEEKPFEWTRPRGFEVERVFTGGPMAHYKFGTRLEPDGKGTRATVYGRFTPRSGIVTPVVRIVATQQTVKFADLIAKLGHNGPPELPAGRIDADDWAIRAAAESLAKDLPPGRKPIVDQLADDLMHESDRELVGIRPFVWADGRGLPRMAALEVFLHATKAGLVDMEWAIKCPHCRGRPLGVSLLADLPEEGACPACAQRFAIEFDRAVETRFSASARFRRLEAGVFCAGGPMNRPFIWAQVRIGPREEREIAHAFPIGAYRVSLFGKGVDLWVREGDASATVALPTDALADPAREHVLGTGGTLRLVNQADREITVAVEAAGWEDRSATAAIVSTLQVYQDLFATDVLSAGQEIAIRRLAVLFSDLKGSTALYQELGDARAYAVVRDHFRIFEDVISAHEGVLVKTIGDAVMAVFSRSKDAVAAAREAHARMAPPVILRIGIHAGPLLAVRSNRRNDYFGSTVNVASRLEHVAEAGETVISAEVASEIGDDRACETVRLKGIDAPVLVVRCKDRP